MIVLTPVSDLTELAIVSIEHNMHADLSISPLSWALCGEYSLLDICMHIYIGKV